MSVLLIMPLNIMLHRELKLTYQQIVLQLVLFLACGIVFIKFILNHQKLWKYCKKCSFKSWSEKQISGELVGEWYFERGVADVPRVRHGLLPARHHPPSLLAPKGPPHHHLLSYTVSILSLLSLFSMDSLVAHIKVVE